MSPLERHHRRARCVLNSSFDGRRRAPPTGGRIPQLTVLFPGVSIVNTDAYSTVYDFSLVHREDTLYVLLYDQNFSPNLFSAPLGGQPFSPESLAARFVQERLTHTFIDLRILATCRDMTIDR